MQSIFVEKISRERKVRMSTAKGFDQLVLQNKIDVISHQWNLCNIRPFLSGSTNNYSAQVYSEKYKTDIVLKVLFVDTHEPEALIYFNGNGCVKILDYDEKLKCFLMEYVQPGTMLKSLFPENDNDALTIVAQLIKQMHVKKAPAPIVGFKTINQWLEILHNVKSTKIAADMLIKAQKLSLKLLEREQKLYVLHGDLHHENVLKNGHEWIVIDPKGVIGPLEYEVGRFIMNPIFQLLQQSNARHIIANRINKFSEIFDFDKQRLIDWAFAQAVLSACWAEEDGREDVFNYFVKFAKIIEKISRDELV